MQVRSSRGDPNFEVGVPGPDCGSGLAANFYFEPSFGSPEDGRIASWNFVVINAASYSDKFSIKSLLKDSKISVKACACNKGVFNL
jgi:hypothetical protein